MPLDAVAKFRSGATAPPRLAAMRADLGDQHLPCVIAGVPHTVFCRWLRPGLLRRAGTAAAGGRSCEGQCDFPAPVADVAYAAGCGLAAVLRSDGTSEADQCLPGVIAGRALHALCRWMGPCSPAQRRRRHRGLWPQLRRRSVRPPCADRGRALHAVCRWMRPGSPAQERQHRRGLRPQLGRSLRPQSADRGRAVHPAAGCRHAVLLRSDGTAEACDQNCEDQCLPGTIPGVLYTQLAGGCGHAAPLRSAGAAAACGRSCEGQYDLPVPIGDVAYTQFAAGCGYAAPLWSDGATEAHGLNCGAQCLPGPIASVP